MLIKERSRDMWKYIGICRDEMYSLRPSGVKGSNDIGCRVYLKFTPNPKVFTVWGHVDRSQGPL